MQRLWSASRLAFLIAFVGLSAMPGSADEIIPPDASPRWWKGNLHTHTLWSDGDDFPEMVAEWYRTRGYNFLALSDHNVLSDGQKWMLEAAIEKRGGGGVVSKYRTRYGNDWVESRGPEDAREFRLKPLEEFRALVEERGKFIMIQGEEITDKVKGLPVHMNASNLRDPIQPLSGETVAEAMTNNLRAVHDQAQRAGREILMHLNHPNYHYAVTAEDLAHVVLERHFEVYNGHPGTGHHGDDLHPGTERLWDIANTIRLTDLKAPALFGVATDDSHSYHGKPNASHPGRGWVMVRATHLTPEYIVRAMKAGDFYASSGVVLDDVRYDKVKKTLSLDIADVPGAKYTTQFIGTMRGVDLTSEPVEPTDKKQGRITNKYSGSIGQVLATVEGRTPSYKLTGKELYVRAVVTSTLPPDDPSFDDQRQQAWTQPVGWE
jgi:hypothetical protein